MFRKSLQFQILVGVLSVIALGLMVLYYLSSSQIKKTMDEYQLLYYTEKVETIIQLIDTRYEKLQKTGMVSAYEESFKEAVIAEMVKIYFDSYGRMSPFLINEDRILIIPPTFNGHNIHIDVDEKLFHKRIEAGEKSVLMGSKKNPQWVVFKYYLGWDWIVGYVVPERVKYQALEAYTTKFLGLTAVVLLVVVFFIVMIVKYLLSPIAKLISASAKIASGDLTSKIDINGSDELTKLSQSFSTMRDEIKKNMEALEQTNAMLEETVLERTKKLQTSNASLAQSIEHLKLTQKQLVESEKIASLGELVAGVAHEVNTPIGLSVTGITHLTELNERVVKLYREEKLDEKEFDDFLETMHTICESIYVSLRKAAELIQSFKKIAVDRASEIKRSFDVKEYLEEILLSLHSITKKTKHRFILTCKDDLVIESYPGLLSQVLTNLIMNSLIHGFKEIQTGEIQIDVAVEDEKLLLSYKDNGCGIKEADLKRIFDPFYTTNRNHGGSGLGMNIVYNIIVTQMNGTIDVKSVVGEGVEISIDVPLT